MFKKNFAISVAGTLVLLLLASMVLSADCATGGSCTFANGDLFTALATMPTR